MPIPHSPITTVTCRLLPPYLPLNAMSYQALLFCPDEKTARVVTQVLSELEFTCRALPRTFCGGKKIDGPALRCHRGGLRQRAERGPVVQERAQLRFEPGFTGGCGGGRADRRGQGFSPGRESGSDQTHSCRAIQRHAAGCARPAAQGTGGQAGRSGTERGAADDVSATIDAGAFSAASNHCSAAIR